MSRRSRIARWAPKLIVRSSYSPGRESIAAPVEPTLNFERRASMANLRQLRNPIFGLNSATATAALAIAITFMLIVVSSQPAQAQTFRVIHTFTGGGDGASPQAGVTIDGAGNLYGTASEGGDSECNHIGVGCGTVYKLEHRGSGWTLNVLYTFTGGSDGADPAARVVFDPNDPNGVLYGTTLFGGNEGVYSGGVFKLRPSPTPCRTVLCPWTETVLYAFTGGFDGARPNFGDVTFDHAGNMYGTTLLGGAGEQGVVWELTPPGIWGTETVQHAFTNSPDGAGPENAVIFDSAGNLYGTTFLGGNGGYGTVFQLVPGGPPWTENILYNFQDVSDGGALTADLIFDRSGNLYGATTHAGTGGGGTIFELSPPGAWNFTVLYSITGNIDGNCPDGAPPGPGATLAMDPAGNIYGTTCADGLYGYGNVFKLTTSNGGWTYTDLYDFTGSSDGAFPISNVVFDMSGNLYGTASAGGSGTCNFFGAAGCGVVWEITP
jgi:hypothetical protein